MVMTDDIRDWFTRDLGVSRETCRRLEHYGDLLVQWQNTLNLVGAKTLPQMWVRHFQDSAQLIRFLPDRIAHMADIGSGAGFPGIVLSILTDRPVTLIEADARKAVFLSTVARAVGAPVTVRRARLEKMAPLRADVMTARAVADVARLLEWGGSHLTDGGRFILLKGRRYEQEIDAARQAWSFTVSGHPSVTDPDARIVLISEVKRDSHRKTVRIAR